MCVKRGPMFPCCSRDPGYLGMGVKASGLQEGLEILLLIVDESAILDDEEAAQR
jgi:hypothetical protein